MTIYHSFAILLPWAAWLAYWTKASSWAKQTGRTAFAYVAVHSAYRGLRARRVAGPFGLLE
jgi:hypothetical protein